MLLEDEFILHTSSFSYLVECLQKPVCPLQEFSDDSVMVDLIVET